MRLSYHGTPRKYFESLDPSKPYVPEPFAREGFIHTTEGREAVQQARDAMKDARDSLKQALPGMAGPRDRAERARYARRMAWHAMMHRVHRPSEKHARHFCERPHGAFHRSNLFHVNELLAWATWRHRRHPKVA